MKVPRSVAAVVMIALSARSAMSQEIRGTVRDSLTGIPVAGAVLTLLDSSGAALGRMLTTERGEYHIRQLPSVRRIRAQRLGFRMREVSAPITVSQIVQFDFELTALPSLLEPVRMISMANCPKRKDRDAAFALLQQARAGLLTTIVARDANPARLVRLQFARHMEGASDRIAEQSVQRDTAEQTPVSFTSSRTGEELARLGFAEEDTSGSFYHGPDAEVLLDDGFAGAYCFRIVEVDKARRNQIGLGFSPASRKRGRVDIEGTLWIDTAARALRDVEYRYVGLGPAESMHPGGRTSFREMANGVVLVSSWMIRLPKAGRDTSFDGEITRSKFRGFRAYEGGGELAHATWSDGTTWHASLGTFRGRARLRGTDSAGPGVIVSLAATSYVAVTDSNGHVELHDLLPGPYSVDIIDQRLLDLGLTIPTGFTFVAARDSAVVATFDAPTLDEYVAGRCKGSADRPVLVLGRIFDQNRLPVEDADVILAKPGGEPFDGVRIASDGTFHFCFGPIVDGEAVEFRVRRGRDPEQRETRTLKKGATIIPIILKGSSPTPTRPPLPSKLQSALHGR